MLIEPSTSVPVSVIDPPFALVDSAMVIIPAALIVTPAPVDVLVKSADEDAPPAPTPSRPSFVMEPSTSVDVTTKFGYVPVTTEIPAPVMLTV